MKLTDVLYDPELGCTAFTVERITYTRSRNGTGFRCLTSQAMGCVHPGTPETLRLLPEEERNETFIVVYTDYPLRTGAPEAAGALSFAGPDRIQWNNSTWRVVRVREWQGFGYVQALAVLLHEQEAV